MPISPPPLTIGFYRKHQPQKDHHGRLLEDILQLNDQELEYIHNYIQYLFPLTEPSPFQPDAPMVTAEVYRAFRASDELGGQLRQNLHRAFVRMLAFYGFSIVEAPQAGSSHVVVRTNDHRVKFRNWVRPFSHNHFRITRIIRSLRLLGLRSNAILFYNALIELHGSEDYGGIIKENSINFWERAVTWELWNPPSENKGTVGVNCEFLVNIEAKETGLVDRLGASAGLRPE